MNDEKDLFQKLIAADSNVASLRFRVRTLSLARALDCSEAKAEELAVMLAKCRMSDEEFEEHVSFMAKTLADMKKAVAERPPQVTDLPAPAAGGNRKVAELHPETERVRADVAAYMADQFGIDIDIEDEDHEP
jgi:hypothetical protein